MSDNEHDNVDDGDDEVGTKKAEKRGEGKDEEKEDLSDPNVVTKYKKAAEIVNGALELVIKACAPGKKIVELCDLGDRYITEQTAKIYNNKKIEKGIGFPTCISVNNVVDSFSPLSGDETTLKDGDVIKIDCGAHIDGYIAVGAHTIVLSEAPVTGPKANVIAAAQTALQCALRLLKAGNKNFQLSEIIAKVAAEYKVQPVAGVLSHQMSRFVIDGEKIIANKVDPEQKVEKKDFEPNEVYALDIVMSTGDGKPSESSERTTVYKRALETNYRLKLKTSKAVLTEVNKRFPTFPFTIRSLGSAGGLDEKKIRFGLVECANHDLLQSYPVMLEKEGETVAQFKVTALMMPNGTVAVTGLPFDATKVQSDIKVTNSDIQTVLSTSMATGKKKKKAAKKKKKKPAGAGGAGGAGGEAKKEEEDEGEDGGDE